MYRGFDKVKAVRNARRNDQCLQLRGIHLYPRPLTSGRRSGPQVAESKDSAPADNGQIVGMPDVHVHATKDVRLGVDDVSSTCMSSGTRCTPAGSTMLCVC